MREETNEFPMHSILRKKIRVVCKDVKFSGFYEVSEYIRCGALHYTEFSTYLQHGTY
jgi:hypothetical protein